jgi:hypothetical protein
VLYSVTEVSVRPEAIGDYEETVRRLVAHAAEDSGAHAWWVWEVSSGVCGSYRAVVQARDWAEVGAATSLGGVLGRLEPDEAQRLERQLRSVTSSVVQYVIQGRPDLSVPPSELVPLPLLELTQLQARPRAQKHVEHYLRHIVEAVGKARDKRRFYTSEAELLVEAFGADRAAELGESFIDAIESAERHVLSHRADLSNHR